jgi:hypothetical protein
MITRAEQVMWVVDHLDDLDSDFSVLHGEGDALSLPAPRFFARAARLAAYPGVMRLRVENEIAERNDGSLPAGVPAQAGTPTDVQATREAVALHGGFAADPQAGFPAVFETASG